MYRPPTRAEELDLLRHPEKWVNWPYMTLKHRTKKEPGHEGLALLGVVVEDSMTVIEGCLWQLTDDARKHSYSSLDALLNDWQID